MKKVLKYLVIATALTVGLTFMPQTVNDVFAARVKGSDGNGESIDSGGGDNSSNSSSGGGGTHAGHLDGNGVGSGNKTTGTGSGGISKALNNKICLQYWHLKSSLL